MQSSASGRAATPGCGDGTLAGLAVEALGGGPGALVLSVDVEDWFHSNFRSAPALDESALPRRVEEGVARVLDRLARSASRATFFVLGCVAREHARLARRIADAGHEVACHGWSHTLVYEQTREAFAADLARARALLRDQSGQAVDGFRAPSWSITRQSLWALDAVAEAGFRYDSSIFPVANYLYGIEGAPIVPYRVRTPSGHVLVEVPPPVLEFAGRRLGVGGGFYLRVLPLALQLRARDRTLRRGAPFVAYVHPRELDPGAWRLRLPLSLAEQWIHRFGIRRVESRLEALRGGARWQSLAEFLHARAAFAP